MTADLPDCRRVPGKCHSEPNQLFAVLGTSANTAQMPRRRHQEVKWFAPNTFGREVPDREGKWITGTLPLDAIRQMGQQ
jgi:hypothetical protein